MRRVFTVLTAAFVAFTFSSMAFAQAPATTEKKPVAKTEKAPAKSAAEKPLSANGKVAKFDEATKTLTVTTKAGEKEFTMAPEAKITAGAKTEMASDLAGKNVKVTYTVVNGKNVASKVTVPEAKPATATKPATAATKPAAEKK